MKLEEHPLDPRSEEVLQSVIHRHVLTSRPVGSRIVSRTSRDHLSAATIRNIMADLEEAGFLMQPHTSAGRLPTEKGYRYYVDSLLARGQLPRSERSLVESALLRAREDLSGLMEEVSRVLSRLSRQVGMVLSPDISLTSFQRIEFRCLSGKQVLGISVDSSGHPHILTLQAPRVYRQWELDQMGQDLMEGFSGIPLREMPRKVEGNRCRHQPGRSSLWKDALELMRAYLSQASGESSVIVGGTEEVMDQPEFSDVEKIRSLFRTIHKREKLGEVLNRYMAPGGVQIHIGTENLNPDLIDFTLVTSTYGLGGRVLGTLGILGPIRMRYDRSIAVVDYVSKVFSHLLTEQIH